MRGKGRRGLLYGSSVAEPLTKLLHGAIGQEINAGALQNEKSTVAGAFWVMS